MISTYTLNGKRKLQLGQLDTTKYLFMKESLPREIHEYEIKLESMGERERDIRSSIFDFPRNWGIKIKSATQKNI